MMAVVVVIKTLGDDTSNFIFGGDMVLCKTPGNISEHFDCKALKASCEWTGRLLVENFSVGGLL